MLWRKGLWALGSLSVMLFAMPASLSAQSAYQGYLDYFIVQVKPEKAADFEAIGKKIADINRRNNGDTWLAMGTVYGDATTYAFVSARQDYADIDKGGEAFMGALHKALGKEGTDKLMHDLNNCLVSSHAELRMRRPDLSSKVPSDAASFNKFIGESRVLRIIAIHVRPGHAAGEAALIKEISEHANNNPKAQPVLISQSAEGTKGETFYVTFLRASLGSLDKEPTLVDILGQEGLAKLMKTSEETVSGIESAIYRFIPGLSNPPKEITEVAADFWQPKAMAASATAKPKPKAPTASGAEATPAAVKSKEPKEKP